MSRDWSREPYRKLLRNPSSSFRSMCALAQAIFYVLVREADDDGRLVFDRDWSKGCARLNRLLGTEPRERKLICRLLKELTDDGCVLHVDDHLLIKNLVAANVRRDFRKNAGPSPTETHPRLDRGSTEARPSVSRDSTESEPSLSRASTAATASVDSDASTRNDSPEPASRARSQVGREVGRKVDPDPRERQRLQPAPNDHPLTELIAANAALVFDVPPARLAAGVISVAGSRSESDQIAAVEIALSTVARQLGTTGLDDPPRYFLRCAQKLLAPGGLEAERAKNAAGGDGDEWENLPSRQKGRAS